MIVISQDCTAVRLLSLALVTRQQCEARIIGGFVKCVGGTWQTWRCVY